MLKLITLRNTEIGWTATFHDDTEVFALFGTPELLTPYPTQARPGFVLERISALNPQAVVELAS